MKKELTKLVPITLTKSEKDKAIKISTKILGKRNISGLFRYYLNNEQITKTRYFVIPYHFNKTRNYGFADIKMVMGNGYYPNEKYIEKEVNEQRKKDGFGDGYEISVINIIEITKQDFDIYIDEGD